LPVEGDINILDSWLIGMRRKAIQESIQSYSIIGQNSNETNWLLEKAQTALWSSGIQEATVLYCGVSGSRLHDLITGIAFWDNNQIF
jgi:hypothetical protein